MMELRPYQNKRSSPFRRVGTRASAYIAGAPTGTGKTVVFSKVVEKK